MVVAAARDPVGVARNEPSAMATAASGLINQYWGLGGAKCGARKTECVGV